MSSVGLVASETPTKNRALKERPTRTPCSVSSGEMPSRGCFSQNSS